MKRGLLCILALVFLLACPLAFASDLNPNFKPTLVAKPAQAELDGALLLDARSAPGKEFIPGSVPADWKKFYDRQQRELLPADKRKAALEALGVTGKERVIVYDSGPGDGSAYIVFWLLDAAGHQNVAVLEGGFAAYKAAGLPVSASAAKPKKASFSGQPAQLAVVTLQDMMKVFGDYDFLMIDPRSDEEYLGWALHGEKRGGHILGAVNFDPAWAYDAAGKLKPEGDIRRLLYSKGLTPEKRLAAYSNADGRGAAMYYLLRVMGHERASHTSFTYNVWADNPQLPVAAAENWQALVSPEWLHGLITTGKAQTFSNKKFAVYEVSWGGLDKAEKYKAGHIPGSFHLDSDTFEDERHYWDLFPFNELSARFAEQGIDTDTTVIVYGNGSDIIAASIAFWALKYAGVDARLLNGNYERWLAKGLPAETTVNVAKPVADFGRTEPGNPQYFVSTPEAKEILADPNGRLAAVRSWEEHTGEVSRHSYIKAKGEPLGACWARAGFGENKSDLSFYTDPDGSYRSYTEVRKMWSDLDINPQNRVAFFCGTGARASTGWFFSYLMGWPNSALYHSGWYGWSEGKEVSPNPAQNIWRSIGNK